MKRIFTLSLGVALIALGMVSPLQSAEPAGYVDFGKFSPSGSGGEFIEVNLRGNLIAMVAKLAAAQEPEVAELLGGLQRVRVNVIGMNDENRAEVGERMGKIRVELEDKGWDRIVTAQEGSEDIRVYLKTRDDEAVEGLVVMVVDKGKEAVLVNVVGDIRPEQIATLGERFHIEPLKEIGLNLRKS